MAEAKKPIPKAKPKAQPASLVKTKPRARSVPRSLPGQVAPALQLSSLVVTDAADRVPLKLVPDFDPHIAAYTLLVPNSVEQVTIAAVKHTSGSILSIFPTDADTSTAGHQVNLAAGADTDIDVDVSTTTPSATHTYDVDVTRHADPPTEIATAINAISGVSMVSYSRSVVGTATTIQGAMWAHGFLAWRCCTPTRSA